MPKEKTELFSFVIPCYKSTHALGIVLDEIHSTMAKRPEFLYEIVLVNDCSPDDNKTWELIKEYCSKDSRIKGVDLSKNFGQACALMAGFSVSSGDYVISAEDDGQSSIEYLWEMFDTMGDKYDIICARNVSNPKRSLTRTLGRRLNQFVLRYFLEKPKEVSPSIFFVAKRVVIEEMLRYDMPYPYIGGLILRSTSKIGNYDISRKQRLYGEGGYTLKKLVDLLINGVTTFSIKPLRITFLLGFIHKTISLIAFIVWIVRLILHRCSGLLDGAGILFLLFMVSGTCLLGMSILGEYIGRIYMCLNHKPQFVIRSCVNRSANAIETDEQDVNP